MDRDKERSKEEKTTNRKQTRPTVVHDEGYEGAKKTRRMRRKRRRQERRKGLGSLAINPTNH